MRFLSTIIRSHQFGYLILMKIIDFSTHGSYYSHQINVEGLDDDHIDDARSKRS